MLQNDTNGTITPYRSLFVHLCGPLSFRDPNRIAQGSDKWRLLDPSKRWLAFGLKAAAAIATSPPLDHGRPQRPLLSKCTTAVLVQARIVILDLTEHGSGDAAGKDHDAADGREFVGLRRRRQAALHHVRHQGKASREGTGDGL